MRLARATGARVAQAHLRHLNPFPANTGQVLRRYHRVIVPEMNLGQLAMLLRAQFLVDVQSHTAVRGLPFQAAEIAEVIGHVIGDAVRAASPVPGSVPESVPEGMPESVKEMAK